MMDAPKIVELGPYSWESSIDMTEHVEETVCDLVHDVGEWPGIVRITVEYIPDEGE